MCIGIEDTGGRNMEGGGGREGYDVAEWEGKCSAASLVNKQTMYCITCYHIIIKILVIIIFFS